MAISPYEAYSIYSAIRLHFTSDSYDVVKYNFKTRSKQSNEKFLKRKDRYFFARLSKKFNSPNHLQEFLACNFMYRTPSWVGNLLEEDADKVYGKYLNYIEGFTGRLESDIITIRDQMLVRGLSNPNKLFTEIEPDTDFPYIINAVQREEVRTESIIALDEVLGFLVHIDKKQDKNNLIWATQYKKLNKYSRLIRPHINIAKVKSLLKAVFTKELEKARQKEQTEHIR